MYIYIYVRIYDINVWRKWHQNTSFASAEARHSATIWEQLDGEAVNLGSFDGRDASSRGFSRGFWQCCLKITHQATTWKRYIFSWNSNKRYTYIYIDGDKAKIAMKFYESIEFSPLQVSEMKINRKSRIMKRTSTERSNGATNLNLRPWSRTSTWSDNDAWLTTMAIWHFQHGYIDRYIRFQPRNFDFDQTSQLHNKPIHHLLSARNADILGKCWRFWPDFWCSDVRDVPSSLLLQIWWWRKARLNTFKFCKFPDFLVHLRCHGVISASVHQHATSVKTWCIR